MLPRAHPVAEPTAVEPTVVELAETPVSTVVEPTVVEPAETPETSAAPVDLDRPWFELMDALEIAAKSGLPATDPEETPEVGPASADTDDVVASVESVPASRRRRWWRRSAVEQPDLVDVPAPAPVETEEPADNEPFVDPAAAVAFEGAPEPAEPVVRVDRRQARRARRRGGRRATDLPDEEDLLLVDPAAAVAPELTIEPEPEPELEPEPEPESESESESEPEVAPTSAGTPVVEEPQLVAGADLTMPVLEVPEDAPAEFVRDFLRDVQHLVHGGVPTSEQVEAAEERAQGGWLPSGWVPIREPKIRRTRRNDEPVGPLSVVRTPAAPQRRREKTRPKRSTRLARYSLVVLLIGGSAALPWVAPEVPTWFASALPDDTETPINPDPTIQPAPTPTAPVPTPTEEPTVSDGKLVAAGRPLEVWVPRLKVRSPVVPISGQSGTLLPPDDAQILGWWQEGRGAGAENGSAVVTGHTISTGGGAFDNLGLLVPGDRLRVRTALGWITYAVEGSRDYTVAELARNAEDIFELEGAGRLVLITCSDFNGEVYLSNAVVVATPVGDEPFVAPDGDVEEVPDGGLVQPWDLAGGNTGDGPGVQLTEKPF